MSLAVSMVTSNNGMEDQQTYRFGVNNQKYRASEGWHTNAQGLTLNFKPYLVISF
jgi:hypothetical protein